MSMDLPQEENALVVFRVKECCYQRQQHACIEYNLPGIEGRFLI